jgi:hypothetical protein
MGSGASPSGGAVTLNSGKRRKGDRVVAAVSLATPGTAAMIADSRRMTASAPL